MRPRPLTILLLLLLAGAVAVVIPLEPSESITRSPLNEWEDGFTPLGFAVDTLFYAAILWLLFHVARQACLLFHVVRQARRRFRTRRGLCPACKYPVGESSVCSECGKAVRPTPGYAG